MRTGEVFSLNWNVELPDPSPFRQPPVRHQVGAGSFGRDDWLDRFYLQGSSQWDGLRHIAHPRHGFYNGVAAERVDDPAERHARHPPGRAARNRRPRRAARRRRARGGRGGRSRRTSGSRSRPTSWTRSPRRRASTVEPGDVLLVRTGWTGWYAAPLAGGARRASAAPRPQPGLEPVERTAEWLWDHHVAAVAADNLALETMPLDFREGHCLHFWLIPCLGMPIGELWWLDDLAAACARDRRWTFQLVSAPLNVRGGVGSPPNALAIR